MGICEAFWELQSAILEQGIIINESNRFCLKMFSKVIFIILLYAFKYLDEKSIAIILRTSIHVESPGTAMSHSQNTRTGRPRRNQHPYMLVSILV